MSIDLSGDLMSLLMFEWDYQYLLISTSFIDLFSSSILVNSSVRLSSSRDMIFVGTHILCTKRSCNLVGLSVILTHLGHSLAHHRMTVANPAFLWRNVNDNQEHDNHFSELD